MNELLKNLINIGQVTSFINNVLVEIESGVGHDKLMKELSTRIEVNDLYINLKKCKWKVREVGFLEVVIEPDRIKIEKGKLKTILD